MSVKRKFKFLAIAAVLSVCLLFYGCENNENTADEPQTDENLPTLVIGCDLYEPYSYVDSDGNFAGIDIELAEEACARMGYKPEFKFIKWDEKKQILADNEVDCVWSCFSMNGRENDYLWAGPYFYSLQSVAVLKSSDINTISELKGRTVAVQSSTKPESLFLDGADGVPDVKSVYCFTDMEEMFGAVKKGYIDACAGHESALRSFISRDSADFRILYEPLQKVGLGIAFDKQSGDRELVRKLSETLNEMHKDRTTAKVFIKYNISAEIFPEVSVID